MKLRDRYLNLTDRIYQNYSVGCQQMEELIRNPAGYMKEVYHCIIDSQKLKKDLASTVAVLPIIMPLYARIETTVGGLSNSVSMKSRLIAAATTYVLIAIGLEGREKIRKKFGVVKESSRLKKALLDIGYVAGILIPFRLGTYLLAGEREWNKILLNTGMLTAIGAGLSIPLLMILDGFKELVGIEDNQTLPKALRNKSKKFKKNLAVGYLSAGLAATIMMYAISPNHKKPEQSLEDKKQSVIIEKVTTNNIEGRL